MKEIISFLLSQYLPFKEEFQQQLMNKNKYLAKRDLDTMCLDNIDPERKEQILDIKNKGNHY